MNLRLSYPTIRQSDIGDSLALSPPPFPVELSKTRQFSNRSASREGFGFHDRTYDLEEHCCGF